MAPLRALLRALRDPLAAAGRRRDIANIRALARRLGCSVEEAERVYYLARRDGFGSAYDEVFGPNHPTADQGPATAQRIVDRDRPSGLLARRRR